MPVELGMAARRQHKRILRPRGPAVVFIQLDDLNAEAMRRVLPVSFLALETSPRNYQAWIATPEATEDLSASFDTLRRRSDRQRGYASGGQPQFQEQVCAPVPARRNRARLARTDRRKETLAQLGLLTDDTPQRPQAPCAWAKPRASVRSWPSYQRCIAGAPLTRDNTRPDISRADFTWCIIAIDWDGAPRIPPPAHGSEHQGSGEWGALRLADRPARCSSRRPQIGKASQGLHCGLGESFAMSDLPCSGSTNVHGVSDVRPTSQPSRQTSTSRSTRGRPTGSP